MTAPWPIVENEALLESALRKHPEFQLAFVCSCGTVGPAASSGGHVGGSNRKWTIKAKFAEKHRIEGYTLMEASS